jgi:hypothetical protein
MRHYRLTDDIIMQLSTTKLYSAQQTREIDYRAQKKPNKTVIKIILLGRSG